MRKLFYTFLLFTRILQPTPAPAQMSPNNLAHYSELDGTIIYDVMPDHLGNIWMATQNGLVKYNGYEFQRFYQDPNDSTCINSILTYSLFEDQHENIWIGCTDAINRYDPIKKTFKHYEYSNLTDFPEETPATVVTITSEDSGRIWFGVSNNVGQDASHALLFYDEKSDKVKRFDYPDSLDVKDVYGTCSDNNNLWILSYSGFLRIDATGNLYRMPLPSLPDFPGFTLFSSFTNDQNGLLWFTTNDYVIYSFDPRIGKYQSYRTDGLSDPQQGPLNMTSIAIDSTNNIWIGSNRGLIRFNRETLKFEMFSESSERKLERASINCLHSDSFGNLWIGTASNGLLRYNNRTELKSFVSNKDDKSAILSGWVNSLLETGDGKILINILGDGPDNTGLVVFDPLSQKLKCHAAHSISPDFYGAFSMMIELNPGEVLMNTNLGLCNYYPKNNTIKKVILPGFSSTSAINCFYKDSHDNLWIMTNNGLFIREKESDKFRHIDSNSAPGGNSANNEFRNVFESKKHGMWLMTNDGLFLYDYQSGKIKRCAYDRSRGDVFVSQDINSFYEDSSGLVWVGTWQGGLSRYNVETGNIKTYTTSDGLPSMSIQGILADEKNNDLWLSTFNGLSRFNMKTGQFTNFSLDDGIQSLLFADGAYLKTSGGLFIFGGSNGITLFNPEEIEKNSMPPKVYLTDLKIADKSVVYGQDSIFNFNQNNISIDYLAIHYANPAKNTYAYKLENYDNGWREVGNQRTAFYYNLPPGSYTFRVKASNSNGFWNEEGASTRIVILPPWWKTWWAYFLYVLLLIGGIVLIDRFQRKRVTEKERARAKEKELADAREIEKAYHTLKTTQVQLIQTEKMASLGELTAGIAHEIQNPLNFVHNFAEVTVDLIEEMNEELDLGNTEEVRAIAGDIRQNIEKIHHHGQRASSIVKGMLEHSRTSTGLKELVDINALADEYLRLAFHGLKARDKSFNADFSTDFDKMLPKIEIVHQDIGRVVLNLINNAFYAVSAKMKHPPEGYIPTVIVSTRFVTGKVEISVKDNGNGIPPTLLDKIFQPFFTTKPAGQGTGLGLSLAYDIVKKGHSGDLKVETKEGEGACFIIVLPA